MIKIDDGIDEKSNGIRCEITRQVTEGEYVLKVRSIQPRGTPRFSLWSFKQIPISFVFTWVCLTKVKFAGKHTPPLLTRLRRAADENFSLIERRVDSPTFDDPFGRR